MCAGIAVYAFAYFTPLILQGMGFKTLTKVYLLSAPPNIAAIPYAFGFSWLADKTRIRGPFVLLHAVVTIVGLMLMSVFVPNVPNRLGSQQAVNIARTMALDILASSWGRRGQMPTFQQS